MNLKDAKAIFLLEHCAERCGGYQKDGTCENCEIDAVSKTNVIVLLTTNCYIKQ